MYVHVRTARFENSAWHRVQLQMDKPSLHACVHIIIILYYEQPGTHSRHMRAGMSSVAPHALHERMCVRLCKLTKARSRLAGARLHKNLPSSSSCWVGRSGARHTPASNGCFVTGMFFEERCGMHARNILYILYNACTCMQTIR